MDLRENVITVNDIKEYSYKISNVEVTIDNVKDSLVKVEELKESISVYHFIKRSFDIISSTLGVIILSPIFLIIAIILKIDSKGPVIFKHKRIGKNGKEIEIFKFRTMVENAEELLKKLTPEQEEEYERNYKLENDFRVTRVGKFLRKTSLDELPQLLNILNGDLSVVGPRPIVKDELEKYGNFKTKLLSVRPGLTGNWAANGRSSTSYEERIKLELFYIDNYSILLDMNIMLKTVACVIKRKGAM